MLQSPNLFPNSLQKLLFPEFQSIIMHAQENHDNHKYMTQVYIVSILRINSLDL
jgi:hypothetical protein